MSLWLLMKTTELDIFSVTFCRFKTSINFICLRNASINSSRCLSRSLIRLVASSNLILSPCPPAYDTSRSHEIDHLLDKEPTVPVLGFEVLQLLFYYD